MCLLKIKNKLKLKNIAIARLTCQNVTSNYSPRNLSKLDLKHEQTLFSVCQYVISCLLSKHGALATIQALVKGAIIPAQP